ncbi:unnamed protein product [Trichogramma brassicae]|uniref:Uncharacterized protein n=1 Tax=Trichogramma brassicae TaxID=86971 RepID=A0A6H5HZ86_9HYME|nr:unnamed protein product [Trichogramma brassicae]
MQAGQFGSLHYKCQPPVYAGLSRPLYCKTSRRSCALEMADIYHKQDQAVPMISTNVLCCKYIQQIFMYLCMCCA